VTPTRRLLPILPSLMLSIFFLGWSLFLSMETGDSV
jgi:hypothetical protein